MKQLRYYISGPMRGIAGWNFPEFDAAAAWLKSQGIESINPADHDREVDPICEQRPEYAVGGTVTDRPDDFHSLIAWDLEQIARDDVTGIVLLDGWENSEGAGIELDKALELGKEVWRLRRTGWPDTSAPFWMDRYTNVERAARVRREAAMAVLMPIHGASGAALRLQGRDWGGHSLVRDLETQQQRSAPLDLGHGFVTKDSGKRVAFDSGMVRDTDEGKPRYDLIPLAPLRRLAELYARGAIKYGDRNWQKANSPEELARFKASAFRHFISWLNGEVDEDHGIAVVWNIFAAEWLNEQLLDHPATQGVANGSTRH